MKIALEEALLAIQHSDVPIGALCVINGEIISRRHNEKEMRNDPTAHAEMLAIRDAAVLLGTTYLSGVTLYSTLEPCSMCAGALVLSRCDQLVYATSDPKGGAVGSLYNLCCDPRLNFELSVVRGVCEGESSDLLRTFFSALR